MIPPTVQGLFAQARQTARAALAERLADERYLLGRELELLAVADEWGMTDAINPHGETPIARLRTAVGLRRDLIRRLEAELAAPTQPTTQEEPE